MGLEEQNLSTDGVNTPEESSSTLSEHCYDILAGRNPEADGATLNEAATQLAELVEPLTDNLTAFNLSGKINGLDFTFGQISKEQ